MCGIVGIAGNISKGTRDAMKFMLLVDQIRGVHSTGVAAINGDNEVSVIKKAMNSSDFLDLKSATSVIEKHDNIAIIGHNRAATKGAVNNTNAHPFIHGEITGVHNGTLRNQALLDDHKDFDVDSDNLYHHMAKHGLDDTVSKLNGAYTLVWYNDAEQSLNFVRNNERPMFYAFSKDGKDLLWASESWMIVVGASKANITIDEVQKLPIHTHLKFDLSNFNKWKDRIVDRKSVATVEPYVLPVATTYRGTSYGTFNRVKKFYLTHSCMPEDASSFLENVYYGKTLDGDRVMLEVFVDNGIHLNTLYEGTPMSSRWVSGVCTKEFAARQISRIGEIGEYKGDGKTKSPKSKKAKGR